MGKLHLNAIHPPTKVGGFLAKEIVRIIPLLNIFLALKVVRLVNFRHLDPNTVQLF